MYAPAQTVPVRLCPRTVQHILRDVTKVLLYIPDKRKKKNSNRASCGALIAV